MGLIITTSWLLIALPAVQAEESLPFGNDEACMQGPLEQFGRYIGDWKIETQRLAQDGSGWGAGPDARWIFSCLGGGTAIQDFWFPASGGVGTNLRTYNAESGKWDIAWAVPTSPGMTQIGAEQSADGSIVMHVLVPVPTPLRRITFYPPDAGGWDWQLEFSSDDGETWTPVFKIRATPFS